MPCHTGEAHAPTTTSALFSVWEAPLLPSSVPAQASPEGPSHTLSLLTVEVAGVILRLQMGDEFGLLPQQPCPVQVSKETVLFHLKGTTWGRRGVQGQGGNSSN